MLLLKKKYINNHLHKQETGNQEPGNCGCIWREEFEARNKRKSLFIWFFVTVTQSYFKTFLRGSRGRRSQPPKSIRTSFNFTVGVLEESGEVFVATPTENCRDFWSPCPFLTPAARSSSAGLPHHTFGSAGPAHALLFFLHTPNFNSTRFFKALDETPFLNDLPTNLCVVGITPLP